MERQFKERQFPNVCKKKLNSGYSCYLHLSLIFLQNFASQDVLRMFRLFFIGKLYYENQVPGLAEYLICVHLPTVPSSERPRQAERDEVIQVPGRSQSLGSQRL